jgi:broad specificity phosphatase PhoE
MPRVLWITRHANRQDFVDPEWHETADRPHDPGLSPDGVTQAHKLAQRLAQTDARQIVASPFLRTVQTAHAAAEAIDTSLWLEPGLGEWLNPDWFAESPSLLPPDTLADRFGRVDLTHAPCLTPSFPESRDAMFDRIGTAARCLVRRYDDTEEMLIVGHGATVQGVLLGLVEDDVPDAGCPLASVTQLVHRNGVWQIALRNDTAHLDDAEAADRFQ